MTAALFSLITWLDELSPSERHMLAHLWQLTPQQSMHVLADADVVQAMWQRLDERQQAAVQRLLAEGGSLPVGVLEREFGTIRPHAGFINPRAYLHALQGTPSPIEKLYILGVIQRVRTDHGLVYLIPPEIAVHLPQPQPHDPMPQFAESAAPTATIERTPATLERDLVSLLALAYHTPLQLTSTGALHRTVVQRLAQRLGDAAYTSESRWHYATFLRVLAVDAGLLHERQGVLRVSAFAVDWLNGSPFDRLANLVAVWLESRFDELTTLAGLRWRTTPLHRPARAARRAVLDVLAHSEQGQWLAIDQIVREMQRTNPEFARTNADFETWQIVDAEGTLLHGWRSWLKVEGALIAAIITGPLHWLGLVDVGGDDQPTHVRVNPWGWSLLADVEAPTAPTAALAITRDGRITLAPDVAPLTRFQAHRIAVWQRRDIRGIEHLLLTLRSFDEANERGISREHIERFLQRSTENIPPALLASLREWEHQRRALRGHSAMLLEADDPALLETITEDLQHDLPPHQRLNQQTWAFDLADAPHVVAVLRDHGFGLEHTVETSDLALSERDLRTLLTAALIVQASDLKYPISEALIERVQRLLPTAERAHAQRDATDATTNHNHPPLNS